MSFRAILQSGRVQGAEKVKSRSPGNDHVERGNNSSNRVRMLVMIDLGLRACYMRIEQRVTASLLTK